MIWMVRWGPCWPGILNMPYVGYVAGVEVDDGTVIVRKEYPGGLMAEMELRYRPCSAFRPQKNRRGMWPFSNVRQAMKSDAIEELEVADLPINGSPSIIAHVPAGSRRASRDDRWGRGGSRNQTHRDLPSARRVVRGDLP